MSIVLRDSSFTTKRLIYSDFVRDTMDVPRHSHHCYEIDFFLDCRNASHIVNGTVVPLKPGTLVAMCERDFHQYSVDKEAGGFYQVYSVQFSNFFLDEIGEEKFRLIVSKQLECIDPEECERFTKMFSLLHYEINRDHEDLEGIGSLILQAIIFSALRLSSSYGSSICNSTISKNEITYVNRHFKEPITLNDVAKHVGYSSVYLSKVFKSRHGVSFKAYLLTKRLNFARSLLRSTSLSITEVATQSGFTNLAYFSKSFRNVYGVSPSCFRENNRQGNED